MTGKRIIETPGAPQAIGPYSQAVQVGDWVFCSGQIPLDPDTGELVRGDLATQTRRVIDNLRAVLEAAGLSLADVVKTTVYLADLGDFQAVNAVYAEYFADERPARATIQAGALPAGARVEIDCIATVAARQARP